MSQSPQNPSASSRKQLITPQLVFDTIRHWWLLAVPTGLLLAAGAGAALYVTFEPKYQAKVELEIAPHDHSFPWNRGVASGESFARNQVAFIRSSLVLGPVLARPDIMKLPEVTELEDVDPVDAVSRMISMTSFQGSNYYHLTCNASSPESAAKIANAVADEYLSRQSDHQTRKRTAIIQSLRGKLALVERRAKDLWSEVRQMSIEQTGKDPFAARPDVEPNGAEPLTTLQSKILQLEYEHLLQESRLEAAQDDLENNPVEISEAQVETELDRDPRVIAAQQDVLALEASLADIRSKSRLKEQDPKYREKLAEKERRDRAYQEFRDELQAAIKEHLEELESRRRAGEIQELRAQLNETKYKLETCYKQQQRELDSARQFAGTTVDLEAKRDELARAQALASSINDQIFNLEMQQEGPSRVEKLKDAAPPPAPIEGSPFKRMVMAGGAAFAFPFLLAFLWELRLRRLSTSQQLEEAGRLPILGETARFPVRSSATSMSPSTRIGRALRTFEESVENVRHTITLSQSVQGAQVLGITSATSQEGKTTLAAQLAVSIAKSTGEPTLLIDADMRAPDLHEVFDTPVEPGLAEVLGKQIVLDDAIKPTWMENLHLIPGGRLECSPHKLLGHGQLSEIMQALRGRYKHIVLDTPPVLAASESLLMLSREADATIVCTMRDVSRVEQVRKTSERLTHAGANVVGCVFNGVPQRRYEYTYGKYYYQ